MDAIQELKEFRRQRGRISRLGERFFRLHELNPEILDFCVQELITLRENGWTRTSFGSLWHYCRWALAVKHRAPGETFAMSQNLACHYARAIVILFPAFNGFYTMETAQADSDFGVRIEPAARKPVPGYVRKLQWADGTAIQNGWRPSTPHIVAAPVARRTPVRRKPAIPDLPFEKRVS
jgi:hypothetical protein